MPVRTPLAAKYRHLHSSSAKVHRARLSRVRSTFRVHAINALLVTEPCALRYLTGFTGSNGLLLVRRSSTHFYTDGRYREQAKVEVDREVRVHVVSGGLIEAAVREGKMRECRTLGFDDRVLSHRQYREMKRLLPRTKLAAVPDIVEHLAAVKDETELEALSSAANISDRVFEEILPLIRPGLVERELALEITYRQGRLGADKDSFDPIVASGPRSAMPHAKSGLRRIKKGDAVLMDFGCTVSGYGSDVTRTVFVGRPPAGMKRLYKIVLTAQSRALQAVCSGVPARAIDGMAREIIAQAGFEKYFPHSLGHGIGLGVHESPRIAPASSDVLRTGNVITIEPGVYLPGIGGIRIEDDVVVLDDGHALLTHSPRDLIQL